jgi:hypothetical protein
MKDDLGILLHSKQLATLFNASCPGAIPLKMNNAA